MRVGERIRKMREAQNLSIAQVGEMTDLKADHLEAIEAGDELPAIGTILKLSRVLGFRMGSILREGQKTSGAAFSVHKGVSTGETRKAPAADIRQGYYFESLLSGDVRGQGMEPFMVTFDPAAADKAQPTIHEGEEFLYVLEGHVELHYDGNTHKLEPGDSVYLDSRRLHAFRGVGEGLSRAVAVVYSG